MPVLPDEFPPHPARDASLKSMTAVEAGDREAWLDLFADDAVVQDPVGVSALDPTGVGHRGRDAIGAFFDNVIGPNEVRFTLRGRGKPTTVAMLWPHHDHDGRRPRGAHGRRVHDPWSTTRARSCSLRAHWSVDRLTFG